MASTETLTRAQLSEKYADPAWRHKLLDLLSLVDILSNSIIESKFKVSDELNKSIALSDAGRKVRDQLITKEDVEPKDATLLCLLGLVHIEPLIDIDGIELDRLVEAVSASIIAKRLRYPFIFGRSLYDSAVELFRDERQEVRHEDTLRLLGDDPQGVFHSGHFLIGPFGIVTLEHRRNLSPRLSVPLQHCADLSCPEVHRVTLTTSYEPGVNRNRPALHKVLDQISPDPSDWNGFLQDITEDLQNPYEEGDQSTLPNLLGDAFDDEEIVALVKHAAIGTDGRVVQRARDFGQVGTFDNWAQQQPRPHLLQLLMTETDESLAQIMDDAVREGVIQIPPGEIRRPMVNHRARSGAWRLRSELSSLGYRAVATYSSVTLLRLSSLVRSLFDPESANEMDDLAWILRESRGNSSTERLESFLRTAEPATVLRTLVLARRGNAEKAAIALGVKHVQPDNAFLDVMLWKLGFSPQRRPDIRDEYWKQHDILESLSKTAGATLDLDEDELRAISSNYFVALERFLFDSLIFATWSLLTDHFTEERPFQFYESDARKFTIATLNASIELSPGNERNDISEEPDLNRIVQGFIRLSRHLALVRQQDQDLLRPASEIPKFVKKTNLQRFPFLHSIPFLDLTGSSQVHIVNALDEVGKGLNDSGIMTARNGLLHAKSKQRTPTISEVNDALTRARKALNQLEEIGCVRTTFEVVKVETDSWGRGVAVLRSHGNEIQFSSPSGYDMLGLPSTGKPSYLMQGAIFAAPNEMLRFREGFESRFSDYWSRFPVRPEPGNRTMTNQADGPLQISVSASVI